MSTLNKAIEIAAKAHEGQFDKGGNPYILHPLRLMMKATTEEERVVAVLHDVIEDSNYTLDDLVGDGFNQTVVDAVESLTRVEGESYNQFIHRIKKNDLATQVKILDILDNTDLSRIPEPTEEDYKRLNKYEKAYAILQGRE